MLQLKLLDSPYVALDGNEIRLNKRKNWMFFFFLVVEGKPYSREKLAEIFWPSEWGEGNENKAKTNLRNTLNYFNRNSDQNRLKDIDFQSRFFIITNEEIAFNKESDYWLDVEQFRKLVATPSPRIQAEVVALYEDKFLSNFDNEGTPRDVEEWLWTERLALTAILANGWQGVAKQHEARRHYDEAISSLRTLMKLDNEFRSVESLHQQLMRLYALNGKPEMSIRQYNACERILEETIGVEPSTETKKLLKQIKSNGNIPTLPPVPFQAPYTPPCFVGRTEQIDQLANRIIPRHHKGIKPPKRIAILGMGGIGKTTFTTHLAHKIDYDFEDGVLWADVSYSDPMDITEGWAEAYQYDFSGLSDIKTRSARWRDVINQKNALLVLDNVTSYEKVEPLIPSTGNSVIVITTRNRDVATRFAGDNVVELGVLSDTAGLQLLTQILGENRVQSMSKELEAAKNLCTLLENLPLALEILAYRLKSRPRKSLEATAALLENLVSSLKQLQIENLSVRSSFELSWKMLDADQQTIYRLMGLFKRLNFSAESLAFVANEQQLLIDDHLEDLAALSLVNHVSNSTYYRQHALLAEFACDKLKEAHVDMEVLHQRFADYYYRFAQENLENYDELELIWPNLQCGLEVAHNLGAHELVCDYAEALTPVWFHRGRFTEAREAYKIAHESAIILADNHRIATISLAWGRACLEQDDLDEAENYLEICKKVFSGEASLVDIAEVELLMGRIALERSDHEVAHELLEQSYQNKLKADDEEGAMYARYFLSCMFFRLRGKGLREAEKNLLSLLEMGASKYVKLSITIHSLLGRIYTDVEPRESEKARNHLQKAIDISFKIHESDERTNALQAMLTLCRKEKNLDEGIRYAEDCINLCRRVGTRRVEGLALCEFAQILWCPDDPDKSFQLIFQSISIQREIKDRYNLVYSMWTLALIYQANKNIRLAIETCQNAMRIAKEIRHPDMLNLLEFLNSLLLDEGK